MKKRITLKEIANELNLISTVSKALKNSSEIGDDAKEKSKLLLNSTTINQIMLL